jgi:thioredoxin 1
MASEKVMHLTDDSFDEQTASGYTLIDFWAEWCGPCRALAPVIDEIADELGDKIKVCKLDVDSNQRAAVRFGIRGIPTVIMMKDGKLVDSVTGNDPQRIKSMAARAAETA